MCLMHVCNGFCLLVPRYEELCVAVAGFISALARSLHHLIYFAAKNVLNHIRVHLCDLV